MKNYQIAASASLAGTWTQAVSQIHAALAACYLVPTREPHGASRQTLERRLRYKNRKGRRAARRLGVRLIYEPLTSDAYGSPCPFCGVPRPKEHELHHTCPMPQCLEHTGHAICPNEDLDQCLRCGQLMMRSVGHCFCCDSERAITALETMNKQSAT